MTTSVLEPSKAAATTALLPRNMLLVALVTIALSSSVESFSISPPLSSSSSLSSAGVATRPQCSLANILTAHSPTSTTSLSMSTAETSSNDLSTTTPATTTTTTNQFETISEEEENVGDDDDEEEWIEEEFELLTESDFYNTEWKIGTVLDSSPNTIDSTWVRLTTTEDGSNLATWGNANRIVAKGKWNIDVPSQFFSISRESFGGWFGKQIWAGTLDDYYFMEGTVRGWSPISPASVIGQWQGIRLGVKEEERGVAPWFMTDEEEEENDSEGTAQEESEGENQSQEGAESEV